MGIDFLDCCYRIEKEFQLPRYALDLGKLEIPRESSPKIDIITAGQMLHWVEVVLMENNQAVPEDCWERMRACIAATILVSPDKVLPSSRLIQDLGFT